MATNPLDDLRAAHEGEYFSKRDQELIEKLRTKVKVETATRDIEAAGLQDHALAEDLARLGIDASNLQILHLVPLIQVGWASGQVEPEERALLQMAARQAGVDEKHPAWATFSGLLDKRPSPQLYKAALAYIATVADPSTRHSLLDTARTVAAATGGLFGLLGNTEQAERDVLSEIALKLGVD
jgi:tellurite resistance protein